MLPRAVGAAPSLSNNGGRDNTNNKPPLARPTSSPAPTTLPPVGNGNNTSGGLTYGVTPPSPARVRANPSVTTMSFSAFTSLATNNNTVVNPSNHHLTTTATTTYGSPSMPPMMGPMLPSSYNGSLTLPNTPTATELKRSASSDSVSTSTTAPSSSSSLLTSTNRFFFPPGDASASSPLPAANGHHNCSGPPSNSPSPTPFDSPLRPHASHVTTSSARVTATQQSSLPPLTSPAAAGGGSFSVSPPRAPTSLPNGDQSPRGYHFDAAGTAHLGGHLYVSTGLRTNAAGVPLSRAISPTAASITTTHVEPLISSHTTTPITSGHSVGLGGSEGRRRASSTTATAPTLFSITTADGKEIIKPDPSFLNPAPMGPPPRSWMDESFSDWSVEIGSKVYRLHKMALGRGMLLVSALFFVR
jgi:hypothetical protein